MEEDDEQFPMVVNKYSDDVDANEIRRALEKTKLILAIFVATTFFSLLFAIIYFPVTKAKSLSTLEDTPEIAPLRAMDVVQCDCSSQVSALQAKIDDLKANISELQNSKSAAFIAEESSVAVIATESQAEAKKSKNVDMIDLDLKIEKWFDDHIRRHKSLKQVPNRLHEAHFQFLPVVSDGCKDLTSFGRGDGRKFFCNDEQTPDDCVVLSIGSRGDYSFEINVVRDTGCDVHTFDCTGDFPPPDGYENKITWHKICLGDPAHGELFESYEQALKRVSPTGKITPFFLKMDIEGFEYEVMRHVLTTDAKDQLPNQIAFELHAHTGERLSWTRRYKDPLEMFSFINLFSVFGNYKLVHRDDNEFCEYCSELLMKKFPASEFHGKDPILELFEV